MKATTVTALVALLGLSGQSWASCDSAQNDLDRAQDNESHFCNPSRPDGGDNSVCEFTRAVTLPHAWNRFFAECMIREDAGPAH